jgi:hypothetical protein
MKSRVSRARAQLQHLLDPDTESPASPEFDFRHNEHMALGVNDRERATKMLQGIMGKRLTYRRTAIGPNV